MLYSPNLPYNIEGRKKFMQPPFAVNFCAQILPFVNISDTSLYPQLLAINLNFNNSIIFLIAVMPLYLKPLGMISTFFIMFMSSASITLALKTPS